MQITLVINAQEEHILPDRLTDSSSISLNASESISSWLVDHYFSSIYSNQLKSAKKSVQPNNIIGPHDMYLIHQIVVSSSSTSSREFLEMCVRKVRRTSDDVTLQAYNAYLQRCGLKDLVDLFHESPLTSAISALVLSIANVNHEIDRLLLDYLLELASSCSIYDATNQSTNASSTKELLNVFDKNKKLTEQTISKIYLQHTLCTYLSLLLDTRNEHALVHCLVTPARTGIERRTIVELKRLSKSSKNGCLSIYQILLSFLRRKELMQIRSESTPADETCIILDKYQVGLKEFCDFIEQLQMTIEENEHSQIEPEVTFRKLMSLLSKLLRKDASFHRCDSILKEIIEDFCRSFATVTFSLVDCTSPTRSASSGATLAGRRFLRSIAYLCAKQTIQLPILTTNNDHYNSPSTGLCKATCSRLLRSPLTPLPIVVDQTPAENLKEEDKTKEIVLESVFVWQKKTKSSPLAKKRYRRRKSHRCLDLSTIHEASFDSNSLPSEKTPSPPPPVATRQPLREIDINTLDNEDRHSSTEIDDSIVFSLVNESEKENLATIKKRSATPTKVEPPKKKQKKAVAKVQLLSGQKSITSFFRQKS